MRYPPPESGAPSLWSLGPISPFHIYPPQHTHTHTHTHTRAHTHTHTHARTHTRTRARTAIPPLCPWGLPLVEDYQPICFRPFLSPRTFKAERGVAMSGLSLFLLSTVLSTPSTLTAQAHGGSSGSGWPQRWPLGVADSPGLRVGGPWLWSLWREERLTWQMAGPEEDSNEAGVPRAESFKATSRWMMRERCPPHFLGPHLPPPQPSSHLWIEL